MGMCAGLHQRWSAHESVRICALASLVVVVAAAAAHRLAGVEDKAVESDVLDQQVVGSRMLLQASIEQVLEEGQVWARGGRQGENKGQEPTPT
jgi:membrane protein implicated in regulation of membrane protease activity